MRWLQAGCYFTPQYTSEQSSTFSTVAITAVFFTAPAVASALKESKRLSTAYLVFLTINTVFLLFMSVAVFFIREGGCDADADERFKAGVATTAQKEIYETGDLCEQTESSWVFLALGILLGAVSIAGASMASCCAPPPVDETYELQQERV